jgi:iron complex outermembrane recepter protein
MFLVIRTGDTIGAHDGLLVNAQSEHDEVTVLEAQSLIPGRGKAEYGLVPVMDRQYAFCSNGGHGFVLSGHPAKQHSRRPIYPYAKTILGRPVGSGTTSAVAIYRALTLAGLAGISVALPAQGLEETDSHTLQQIVVVGTTPVPGMTVNVDKVPGNVQTLLAADLKQDGIASIANGLSSRLGSVNINDALADPFQPDILYRGFEASPVLGTPQGLAVYQNGVRINEAFGDTVNWDLFPDIAVSRVDLVSANPLFGLNALGGAISVTMKNGFTFQGADGELSGGSFNQRQGAGEFGTNNGVLGIYAAARLLNQDGWRLLARDSLRQYYMDMSLHEAGAQVDLSYTRADNQLLGQGAAPVQSLAINSENVFTNPQANSNALDFVTLGGELTMTDAIAVQSVLYSRNYRQTVANGNASNYTACTTKEAAGLLCQGDGVTPLSNSTGAPIPDISDGGRSIVGQNDFERIRSNGWGASLQLTELGPLFGHGNNFALGTTFDTAEINFSSGTEVGVLNASLTVLPSGQFVDTHEGSNFSATPVNLHANNKYYGIYLTDTFDITAALSVTASGRYNIAKIDLADQRGTDLNGNNRFTHFDPALGATYKLLPTLIAYTGYSTNNRAPTANEIECSDPLRPCLLPSSLAGDPPTLRQVIAHTLELGLRGRSATAERKLSWNAGVFRTNSDDDIYGIATSVSSGFFRNIGSTRRQGFEAGLNFEGLQWSFYAQYSYVDATFRSPLLLNSPSNPRRDADGNIQVLPGDRLPLIPSSRIKFGTDYSLWHNWSLGASLVLASGSFYRGDEFNRNPQLPGYHVVNMHTLYRLDQRFEIFAKVQNLFDERYSTFGLYSNPTGVGAPGIPPNADSNAPGVDNRFQSPGMPRSFFGGVRISFE